MGATLTHRQMLQIRGQNMTEPEPTRARVAPHYSLAAAHLRRALRALHKVETGEGFAEQSLRAVRTHLTVALEIVADGKIR